MAGSRFAEVESSRLPSGWTLNVSNDFEDSLIVKSGWGVLDGSTETQSHILEGFSMPYEPYM